MKRLSSQKSRWIKFISVVLLYVLLIIADAYTTYLYTPDLSMEANPSVSLFGLGWGSLIMQDIFAVIVFSFFVYFPFVYYKRTVIQCKSLKEYVSLVFFKRPDKINCMPWFQLDIW